MASPLENLSGPVRALQKEAPDAKEFAGLRRSALARLTDSAKNSNSLESRFDLAYNAAHALCLAALRWHGYRPSNRYIVFQTLPHTLGLGPEVWRVLDKCHSVRNLGAYEGDLNVDERLVAKTRWFTSVAALAMIAFPRAAAVHDAGPVMQARVSDIKRGKIGQFSLDMLVRLASRAGLKPRVKLAA